MPPRFAACPAGHDDASSSVSPSPGVAAGTLIGRYELVRAIGSGGFGHVYEAVQESMREETCRFVGADRNRETRVINGRIYAFNRHSGKPLSQTKFNQEEVKSTAVVLVF